MEECGNRCVNSSVLVFACEVSIAECWFLWYLGRVFR